jgi:hypothetical protein
MTPQRYALVIGLVLIAVGFALGLLIPVSVTGDAGSQSCGAPWTGGQPLGLNSVYDHHTTDYRGLCIDARQTRGTIAIVLIGAGAVVAGASFVKRAKVSAPSNG